MSPVRNFINLARNNISNGVNRSSTIQMPSHLSEVNKLVQNILKLLHSSGINKSTSFDIRLCLEEALINAVKHGNKNNGNLLVKIDYSISDEMFKVSIEDKGSGFDYKYLPDPTVRKNLLKTKGRGIYLMKHLMDEVFFNKDGNRITMIKYLKEER